MKLQDTPRARLLSLGLLAALAVPAAAAPARSTPSVAVPGTPLQDPELPDKREEIEVLIDKLDAHAGARGKEDQEAVAVIDTLLTEFPGCGPKDRAAIVKALDKCFKEKRPEEEGGRQNGLYMAAATALGKMAPESVPVLLSWIDHKSHRGDLALQRTLILQAGATRDEEAQKDIVKLLKHHEAQIQAAAAEALGNYGEAEQDLRKDLFKELLETLMTVKGQKDSDPNDTIARDRWDVIAAPIITSMKALAGHDENDPQAWQAWWNDNKKEDWDA